VPGVRRVRASFSWLMGSVPIGLIFSLGFPPRPLHIQTLFFFFFFLDEFFFPFFPFPFLPFFSYRLPSFVLVFSLGGGGGVGFLGNNMRLPTGALPGTISRVKCALVSAPRVKSGDRQFLVAEKVLSNFLFSLGYRVEVTPYYCGGRGLHLPPAFPLTRLRVLQLQPRARVVPSDKDLWR